MLPTGVVGPKILLNEDVYWAAPYRGGAFNGFTRAFSTPASSRSRASRTPARWWGQANVDTAKGTFFAANYTIGPPRFTVAQLGVKFRPSVPVCKLSVRAYAHFSGYDILDHRVHDDSLPEYRRAWALGSVGVRVDSWKLDGSEYRFEGLNWANMWDRSEVNPDDSREYDGSVSSSGGLIVEPLAVSSRDYAVWVTCRVGVSADPGFAVSTYATSSISCQVPFFVVEEIENF